MLEIFKGFNGLERGNVVSPNLNRLFRLQETNLSEMLRFYSTIFRPIVKTSPILRLLYAMDYGNDKGPMDYYNYADEDIEELGLSVGLITPNNKGEIHNGPFYGPDCLNVFVADNKPQEHMSVLTVSNWRDLKPLTLLKTPGIGGFFIRPDLLRVKSGYCAIAINIPVLAFMYRSWFMENQKRPPVKRERIDHFIGKYLYPQLLWSQMDCMAMGSLLGLPGFSEKIRSIDLGLSLVDYGSLYLKELKEHTNDIVSQGTSYEQFLRNLPSFSYGNLGEAIPFSVNRETSTNAHGRLALCLPFLLLVSKSIENNPEASTMDLYFQDTYRYVTRQHIIGKIKPLNFKKLIARDWETLLKLRNKK